MDEKSFLYFLTLSTFIIIGFFIYVKKSYTYFERKKIPKPTTPQWPFGNIEDIILQNSSFHLFITKHYNRFRRKLSDYGGIYLFMTPAIILVNTDLIEDALNENDQKFSELNGCSHSMLSLKSKKKLGKQTMSHIFSTKIEKKCLELMDVSCQLKQEVADFLRSNSAVDLNDLLDRYTIDSAGRIIFGIKLNSLQYEETDLLAIKNKHFGLLSLKIFLKWCFPLCCSIFHINAVNSSTKKLYTNFLSKIIEDKTYSKTSILHALIQEERENKINLETIEESTFDYFLSNISLVPSTISFCLYELSVHEDIQEELRGEILRYLKTKTSTNNEDFSGLTYLGTVVEETLRKYPTCPILCRTCTGGYKNSKYNMEISNGCKVFIPVYSIHHDPNYYPNPESFDPDRFSEENRKFIKRHTYFPFGCGPKKCSGDQLATIQIKAAIIQLISKFKFTIQSHLYEFEDDFILKTKKPFLFTIEEII